MQIQHCLGTQVCRNARREPKYSLTLEHYLGQVMSGLVSFDIKIIPFLTVSHWQQEALTNRFQGSVCLLKLAAYSLLLHVISRNKDQNHTSPINAYFPPKHKHGVTAGTKSLQVRTANMNKLSINTALWLISQRIKFQKRG